MTATSAPVDQASYARKLAALEASLFDIRRTIDRTPARLADLSDVSMPTLRDGMVPTYSTATGKFVAADADGGAWPGIFSPWDRGAEGDLVADDAGPIQDAIDDAEAAGGGRVGPLGKHKCLTGLIQRDNVSLFGLGYGPSQLHFPTDLGAGEYAITYDPSAPGGASAGTLRDFQIIGPGGPFDIGVQTADMDGIRPPAHSDLYNVRVIGCRSGFVMNADHNHLYACRADANYFGVLFPADIISFGSHSFNGCLFNVNNFASVAKEGGGVIDLTTWDACHFGWGPYGIYMADMTGAASVAGITSSVFDGCVFEYCGNGAILDETTGSGAGGDSLIDCTFNRCMYSSSDNAAHRMGARSHDYAIDVRNMRNCRIFEGTLPFSVPISGVSVYRVSGITSGVVEHRPTPGNSGTLPTGSDDFVTAGSLNYANGFTLDTGSYRGHARTAIGTISVGDLLGYSSSPGWVTRLTATGTSATFAGVALNDAVNAGVVIVAPPGSEVDVLCETIAASGTAIYRKSGTEHHGSSTVNGSIVGYSTTPGGGGGGVATSVATRSP